VQVVVDGTLQLFEHLQESQVPGVEGHAGVGWRERLVPLVNFSPVDNGDLKLNEKVAADVFQIVGFVVEHGVVEVQILVAGDARDVDLPSVVVFELVTLHDH